MVAWVDYCKAFDMVPHRWLQFVLKRIRTPKLVKTGDPETGPKMEDRPCANFPIEETKDEIGQCWGGVPCIASVPSL